MIELSVLGRVEAHVDGRQVEITSRTQRILLAALAHARGSPVPTERLTWLVWGDRPPPSAHESLKSHVSRLRRTLGHDVVTFRPPGYALTVGPEHVDLHRFEQGMRAESLHQLDAALALWRGEPFGDLGDHEYLTGEVARLVELRMSGRIRYAELLAEAGRHDDAVSVLRTLSSEHPLHERARIILVTTLHRGGRQADAIAEANRYRADIAEVGLEASPAFVAAERAAFAEPPSPTTPARSGPPARMGTLVGRDEEIDHVCALLGERRLVTLVGPGGVGKTALATEVTRRMADEVSDGVWIAALAEVEDDAGVLPAVVRAVGAPTTQPLDDSLLAYLSARDGLLVLDNTEHVSVAVCDVAVRILTAAGRIRILSTGRQPLDHPDEAVLSVEPLGSDAARRLLTERCRDAGGVIEPHQAELAARICERLDRLPLAIEMAASRLRALSLADLDHHLDQRLRLLRTRRHGRHETLEHVVAWSYDLLDPGQRELFEHLAVFAGPFDLDAAAAVHDAAGTAGLLSDLVDRSLVQARNDGGQVRYQLLETVRSFAGERLEASPANGATIDRFITHHVALAERVGEGFLGPDEQRWVEIFDRNTPNLELAHGRALERDDLDAAIRIASAPYTLIYQCLRADIGAWAEATVEPARRAGHPATAAVLAVAALDRLNRGDHHEAAALLRDLPDDPVAVHAHEVLGDLYTYRGELHAAVEQFARAEALALAGGDQVTACNARMSMAMSLGYAGHREEALGQLREARSASERLGARFVTAWCDFTEAELLVEADPARALELVDSAVASADRAGWRMLAGVGRLTASSLRARSAAPADAVAGFDRLIRHWDRLGDHNHQWTTLRNLVELLVRLGDLPSAAQVLGSVTNSPRPTFGPEEQRLRAAAEQVRAGLGDRTDELIERGAALDLHATIDLALAALEALGGGQAVGARR